MVLVALLIELLKKVFFILCWFCVLAWLPATLGFFGFFNVLKKRYLIAPFYYLGYFIFVSISFQILLGVFVSPAVRLNPEAYDGFFRGVSMGLYVCAALATVNCVVFAFALKKKLFKHKGVSKNLGHILQD